AQFQTKQNAIEWERNYMNAQLEQQRHDEATEVARMTCKDKLLHSLHKEQDSLFAKINQFHDRKDAEKQKMLDNCIEKCKWACCVCIYALQVLCRRLFKIGRASCRERGEMQVVLRSVMLNRKRYVC